MMNKHNSGKTLVTGASGFIGRALCRRLSEEGQTVIAAGRTEREGPWASFMPMDLAAREGDIDLAGIETVYHLASKAHALSECPGSEDGYHAVIVEGTERLLQAAESAQVQRLVYMSSVKSMGEGLSFTHDRSINEQASCAPTSPYGKAKLEAEQLVLKSALPQVVILRPVMVYGPGHKGNLVRMAEAIKGHRFPPIRENGNRRSMVHVDDLVDACLSAAKTEKANREAFIISGTQAYSTRELYNQLRAEMGMQPVQWNFPTAVLYLAARAGDLLGRVARKRMPIDSDTMGKLIGSAWYDNAKSRRVLGLRYGNEGRAFLEEPLPAADGGWRMADGGWRMADGG